MSVLSGFLYFVGLWTSLPATVWLPTQRPRPPCPVRHVALSDAGTLAVSDGRRVFALHPRASAWRRVGWVKNSSQAGQDLSVTGMVFCRDRLLVAGSGRLEIWSEKSRSVLVGPSGLGKLSGVVTAGRRVVAWSHSRVWESPDCGGHWQPRPVVVGERLQALALSGRWRLWLTDRGVTASLGWSVSRYHRPFTGLNSLVVAQMERGLVVAVGGRGLVRIMSLTTGRHLARLVVPGRRFVSDPGGGFWIMGQGLIRVPPSGRAHRADMGLPARPMLAASHHQVLAVTRAGIYQREVIWLARTRLVSGRPCRVSGFFGAGHGFGPAGLASLAPDLSLRAGALPQGESRSSMGFGWRVFMELLWRPSSSTSSRAEGIGIRIRRRKLRRDLSWRQRLSSCRRWKALAERNVSWSVAVRLGIRLGLERAAAILAGWDLVAP